MIYLDTYKVLPVIVSMEDFESLHNAINSTSLSGCLLADLEDPETTTAINAINEDIVNIAKEKNCNTVEFSW